MSTNLPAAIHRNSVRVSVRLTTAFVAAGTAALLLAAPAATQHPVQHVADASTTPVATSTAPSAGSPDGFSWG